MWVGCLVKGQGQESQVSEYKIKAAFVLNFARFAEWPPASFAAEDSPLTIGVFGKNPFGGDLEEVMRNKTISDRAVVTKEIKSLAEATNCQVLFISSSEKKRLAEIFERLQSASVLTVADMDGFTEAGGMINIVREGTKFRFQINNDAAKKANLKLSSKLLSLALPSSH